MRVTLRMTVNQPTGLRTMPSRKPNPPLKKEPKKAATEKKISDYVHRRQSEAVKPKLDVKPD